MNKKLEIIDRELHEKFSECGKNAREWMRKCVMMLPEIEKRRIWEKKGFLSIYEYAAKLAGMSHETVNDALRVMKKIENRPLLKKVVEQKGVRIVKTIVNLVDDSNEKFWAEKASTLSLHTLEAYKKAFFEPERRLEPSEKISVNMELKPEVLAKLEKLKGKTDWNELMEQLLLEREELLKMKKPKAIGKREKTGKVSRYIPAKVVRYVEKKTNGNCAFGNCVKEGVHRHHRNRFSISKKHDPEDIFLLCKEHHDLCHTGLVDEKNWTVVKQADRMDFKFFIDQKVMDFRYG